MSKVWNNNVELTVTEWKFLRGRLLEREYQFEASECYDLIHVEVMVDEYSKVFVQRLIDEAVQLAEVYDTYGEVGFNDWVDIKYGIGTDDLTDEDYDELHNIYEEIMEEVGV